MPNSTQLSLKGGMLEQAVVDWVNLELIMRKATQFIGACVLAVSMLIGSGGAAFAAVNVGMKTQYPSDGGTWTYGFKDKHLRSYYTVNKCHGSTAKKLINGKVVKTSRSANTASGKKSIAEVWTLNSPGLKAKYHYRTC